MIPLPNDDRSNSGSTSTQPRDSILNRHHFNIFDLCELPLCNSVAEVHHSLRPSVGVLLIDVGEFVNHTSDPTNGFLAIILIEREWTSIFDTLMVHAAHHRCKTRGLASRCRMRHVSANKHLNSALDLKETYRGNLRARNRSLKRDRSPSNFGIDLQQQIGVISPITALTLGIEPINRLRRNTSDGIRVQFNHLIRKRTPASDDKHKQLWRSTLFATDLLIELIAGLIDCLLGSVGIAVCHDWSPIDFHPVIVAG